MKKLMIVGAMLMLATSAAYAGCQNVYDPMNHQWRLVCQPDGVPQQRPQCHNVYDPMNHVWVLVCQ